MNLEKQELLQTVGGFNISFTSLNALALGIKTILSLGRNLGTIDGIARPLC